MRRIPLDAPFQIRPDRVLAAARDRALLGRLGIGGLLLAGLASLTL